MKKSAAVLAVLGLIVLGDLAGWRWRAPGPRAAPPAAGRESSRAPAPGRAAAGVPRSQLKLPAAQTLSAAEKAAWIGRIKRDYDEITAKASADYAAAGNAFPGGLNAFLRQLALIEREKRQDFAAVLTPRELEDLELRETNAGQLVQKFLGDTAATDEQRRAVFRLQRAFDDQFALTFDLTPAVLLQRESERQATQRAIGGVLGSEELFAAWLRGEGTDYAACRAFAAQQGLPGGTALELWRAKNDYTLRKLDLNAQPALAPEQKQAALDALAQQARARVLAILGAGAFQAAGPEVLGWLPRGK